MCRTRSRPWCGPVTPARSSTRRGWPIRGCRSATSSSSWRTLRGERAQATIRGVAGVSPLWRAAVVTLCGTFEARCRGREPDRAGDVEHALVVGDEHVEGRADDLRAGEVDGIERPDSAG